MAILEVSDIARSIKWRIREVEEHLKDHNALSDELERLKGALSRLEGEVRSRVDGRRLTLACCRALVLLSRARCSDADPLVSMAL